MHTLRQTKWKIGIGVAVVLLASALAANLHARPRQGHDPDDRGRHIQHVLLISIDGTRSISSIVPGESAA